MTSILKNEKYKGDAILQKSYTVDFLTKKKKINEGELPQYYVENSHPAIISPETFELVQEEFRRRKAAGRQTSAISCFASRIVCGDCGGFYGRKVWHSTSKYANTIWQCNNKFTKRKFCTTPHLKEEIVKKAFVEAFNSIINNKDEILENYEQIVEKIINTKAQEKECSKIDEECTSIEAVIEKLISNNARNVIEQNEYNEKYTTYAARYNELQNRRQELNREISMCRAKHNLVKKFIEELKMQERILEEFDEGLWCATLNTMVIRSEENVVFQFKGGMELEWTINKG